MLLAVGTAVVAIACSADGKRAPSSATSHPAPETPSRVAGPGDTLHLSTPAATVLTYCGALDLGTIERTFFQGARIEPSMARRAWTHCEIVKQGPAPGVGRYLGHIGRDQRDSGFTVAPADVEIITQVEVRGDDGRSSTERFWHILRKFGNEWRIIASGGFEPDWPPSVIPTVTVGLWGLISAPLSPTAERALILAVALALNACNQSAPRSASASRASVLADTPQRAPRDSILKLLHEYARGFGDDRATVISRLGAPRHVATRTATNGIDTLFLLEYPSASFLVSRESADHREILPDIRAWGPLPGLPPVITFGLTTRSHLLTILGPPNYTKVLSDSTVLSYQLPSATDLIEFYMVRDTVRVLRWRFYMG